jgi:endo-1,4-beta-xylanase
LIIKYYIQTLTDSVMRTFAIMVILFMCGLLLNCQEDDKEPEIVPDPIPLKESAPFPIGAAVDPNLIRNNGAYRTIMIKEFNGLSVENAMKLGWLHPEENTFNFKDGDYLVSFAETNNMRVFAHTLIWHEFEKVNWIKNFQGDSAAWENMFKNHIQTVVSHFKGKVKAWDVVNEAFYNSTGQLRVENLTQGNEEGSIWARKLGKDYIARAFTYAHEADPDALLFYNDYAHEWSEPKLTSIINLVNDLKSRGVPIHGVGMQMHTKINESKSRIESAITKMAATGLLVHISELDVKLNITKSADFVFTDELAEKQADMYKFIAATYKSVVPTGQQFGITTWNVTDADSWIVTVLKIKDAPLLFDNRYQKKKAYYGFQEGLMK